MKFSISTSFYNRGHLVENLYKQILAQTHTDWEWIVTDDFLSIIMLKKYYVRFVVKTNV